MSAQTDHLDHIMTVMADAFDPAFGEAWTRRQVEDALLIGNCTYGLALRQDEPAGFYLARTGFEEVELLLLAVRPAWRRQGIGLRLLHDLETAAGDAGMERLLLEMREGNPAQTLYRHFGFTPIGRRENYYRLADGTRGHAITFAKSIS